MPPPPHPQSTPDVARSRSHRGAAGRLGGGTNCWCGTAAAQQPAEGWCPTWAARLGVRRSASSLRVIRRAEALARRGRDHIREHLHGTQAGTPTRRLPAGVPPALRPGRSQRWLNAVWNIAYRAAEEAAGVLCEHISRFPIPILVSRFAVAPAV